MIHETIPYKVHNFSTRKSCDKQGVLSKIQQSSRGQKNSITSRQLTGGLEFTMFQRRIMYNRAANGSNFRKCPREKSDKTIEYRHC